jgi:RNA polymerase sigma-70 factor (ECF subfamily)
MPQLPETRKSLLLQLAEADEPSAWTQFLSIYEPAIFHFAISRGLQEADARDVTQQVLLAVHKKAPQWNSDQDQGSFRGWLFTVTRNLAAKSLRTNRRLAIVNGATLDDVVDTAPNEECSAFFLEYRKQVFRWAANSIKDQYLLRTWNAFWRTSVDGESSKSHAS